MKKHPESILTWSENVSYIYGVPPGPLRCGDGETTINSNSFAKCQGTWRNVSKALRRSWTSSRSSWTCWMAHRLIAWNSVPNTKDLLTKYFMKMPKNQWIIAARLRKSFGWVTPIPPAFPGKHFFELEVHLWQNPHWPIFSGDAKVRGVPKFKREKGPIGPIWRSGKRWLANSSNQLRLVDYSHYFTKVLSRFIHPMVVFIPC